MQIQDSPLDNIWTLCQEPCKYCYYKCTLLQGHDKEHKCPYDHKCKEQCSTCKECNCINNICNKICGYKAGHTGKHNCEHFHKCQKYCDYKDFSIDCKGECILEYNHKEIHSCGIFEHHCKENCILKEKANNCGVQCILKYPHEGKDHDCGNIHSCRENCLNYGKSEGCKEKCKYNYGHKENHNCGEKHKCIEKCDLKDKARNCKSNCILEFPHVGKEHICGQNHLCKNECDLKGKTKGCNEICGKDYNHKGKHNCKKSHFCKDNCYLKDKAKNCNKECQKEYPHEGEHECGSNHLCKEKCSLIDISNNCEKECSLEYGHQSQCECICKLEKYKHICNKKCKIQKDCNRNCILVSNHKGKCLCGYCNCPEECKYINCSKNCYKKCYLKAGHAENEHICESKNHICKFFCLFKDISLKCKTYCSTCLETNPNHIQESIHICTIKKEEHRCKFKCIYFENSRFCNENCSQIVGHKKSPHLCNKSLEQHKCKHICYLFEYSKYCGKFCNKFASHSDDSDDIHICNLEIEKHFCKNKCSLYSEPGKICENDCSQLAKHEGECSCLKPNYHICNQVCELYQKADNCKKYCKRLLGHEDGHHICETEQSAHKCKKNCHLYKKTEGYCYIKCCLPYGHKKKCICSKQSQHLCNKKCYLNEKTKGCKEKCRLSYNHKGKHLCEIPLEKHKCNKKCIYYSIFIDNKGNKGKCNESCCLSYNHKGDCICEEPHSHPCLDKCFLYEKSGGCNGECSLEYKHKGECICTVKRSNHVCKEKCELCDDNETECGHVYNHQNEKNLDCYKCKDNKCKLSGKGHLCGRTHNCKEKCKDEGFCVIKPVLTNEKGIYKSQSGENIQYKVISAQIKYNKFCSYPIPNNEFFHPEKKHFCKENMHFCGFQCIQCEYYCHLPKDHEGYHKCNHGNIKNSFISIFDSNNAMIRKDQKYYKFKQGEQLKIFTCDNYCKNQGQGHRHEIKSNHKIQNENFKLNKEKSTEDYYIYECKCLYFWENILKYEGNFTKDEKDSFSLCDWKCNDERHSPPEYCILDLWHEEQKFIPKNKYGKWVSPQGHVFKCIHSNTIYTIFLVDQSGSMKSSSIKPIADDIQKVMNNMIGASIEAILDYCSIRKSLNPREMCALIGFNGKASLVLENTPVENIDKIKENCLSKLKPEGYTLFSDAFREARKLIDKINRNDFVPVIILLTDGLDHGYQDTINYLTSELMNDVEKKREDSCRIYCIYFQNKEEEYDCGECKGRAEEILKEIAIIGETKDIFTSDTVVSLCKNFEQISEAIQTNFSIQTNLEH